LKYTAIVDAEYDAGDFWDALTASYSLLNQMSDLCKYLKELFRYDQVDLASPFELECFRYYVSSFPGWGTGPDHARNPIIFLESEDDDDN
jgi:hypothetical protein